MPRPVTNSSKHLRCDGGVRDVMSLWIWVCQSQRTDAEECQGFESHLVQGCGWEVATGRSREAKAIAFPLSHVRLRFHAVQIRSRKPANSSFPKTFLVSTMQWDQFASCL